MSHSDSVSGEELVVDLHQPTLSHCGQHLPEGNIATPFLHAQPVFPRSNRSRGNDYRLQSAPTELCHLIHQPCHHPAVKTILAGGNEVGSQLDHQAMVKGHCATPFRCRLFRFYSRTTSTLCRAHFPAPRLVTRTVLTSARSALVVRCFCASLPSG